MIADADAADGKRKASDEPSSPVAAKRVKHDDESAEPEQKPAKIPAIPFPEKVSIHIPVSLLAAHVGYPPS